MLLGTRGHVARGGTPAPAGDCSLAATCQRRLCDRLAGGGCPMVVGGPWTPWTLEGGLNKEESGSYKSGFEDKFSALISALI